ncbi:MAG: O-antigen ligase family protein [Vulcanimicrobiota bacterium]
MDALLSLFERGIRSLLRIGLCLILLYVSLDHGGIHYRPASLFRIFTCLFMCLWLVLPHKSIPSMKHIAWPLTAFIVLSFVSTIYSAYVHDSLLEWTSFLCVFALFFLACDLFSDPDVYPLFIHYLVAFGFILCSIGLFNYLSSHGQSDLFSTFVQRNAMGGAILVFYPLAFLLSLAARSARTTALYGFLAVIFGLCILLTFSRGTYFAFLCMMGSFFILLIFKKIPFLDIRKTILRCLVIFIVTFALFFSLNTLIKSTPHNPVNPPTVRLTERTVKLFSSDDFSRDTRIKLWRAALDISLSHPLLGTGLMTFAKFYPPYQLNIRQYSRYTHCLYVQILSEVGWAAFFAFLGILFFFVIQYFKPFPALKTDDFIHVTYAAAGMSLIGGLVHNFIDYDWLFVAIPALLLSLLGAAYGRLQLSMLKPMVLREKEYIMTLKNQGRRALEIALIPLFMILAFFSAIAFLSLLHSAKAERLVINNDSAAAIEEYIQAAAFDPFSSEPQRELGNLYLKQTWTEKSGRSIEYALDFAKRSVELDLFEALNHFLLGSVLIRKGNHEEGLKHLMRALALDPRNYPLFYNDIAHYYFVSKDYERAEKYYREALDRFPLKDSNYGEDIKPHLSIVYLGMGNIAVESKKDYEEARSYFVKSLELDNSNISSYFAIGFTYYEEKDYEKAIAFFYKARVLAPDYALSYFYTGLSYKGLKKYREAKLFLERSFLLDSTLRSRSEVLH